MNACAASRLFVAIFFLSGLLGLTPASFADEEEDKAALEKELMTLKLQQRSLQRNLRNYQSSLEMLADEDDDPSTENARLALQNQISRATVQMQLLGTRRTELEKALGLTSAPTATTAAQAGPDEAESPAVAAAPASPAPTTDTVTPAAVAAQGAPETTPSPQPSAAAVASSQPGEEVDTAPAPETEASVPAADLVDATAPTEPGSTASDASRLTALLTGYYNNAAPDPVATEDEATERIAQPALDPDKIRLTGEEGLLAVELISERLARGPQSTRRENDLTFNVQLRRDDRLISSSSHSLKSLGKHQYVGKVTLEGGEATITVRRTDWFVELEQPEAIDYLVVLNMPEYGDSSLHIIPIDELKSASAGTLPPWLPYLGTGNPENS